MNKIFGIFLYCLFMSGCGGDGSNASSPTNSSQAENSSSQSNSSFSSLSTSSVSFEEVVYSTDEDQSLVIQRIGIAYAEITDENWNLMPWGAESSTGASIKISENHITYTPKEDFFGQEEIYYREWKSETEWRRFKFIVNVAPVEDKFPKWHIGQVFKAGQFVELPSPLYPDTNQHLVADDSVRLTLGEQQIPYHIDGDKILFEFPVVDRAGFYDLSLSRVGDELVPIVNKSILITLDKGEVTYYIGNENAHGSFLVVLRDDNVSDANYTRWIAEELVPFLNQPIVTQYQKYWNFAVISPVSTGMIWQEDYLDTSAIAVADADHYMAFVQKYVPRNTEIIVIDGRRFRATGGYPVTMNMYDDTFILFHELAHAHAKLGDEYDENCSRGEYRSKTYPNVESNFFGSLDDIQWQHWIKDPLHIAGQNIVPEKDEEIGVFLGAFYCSNKYYRPAKSTLMKSRESNISSVDKEAWALANYENMDFLGSLVSEQKNGVNKLRIEKLLDPALTSIRWFLNDKVLPEFDGAMQIEIDESAIEANSYNVTAELIDLTGIIRNPHAYKAFNEHMYDENLVFQTTGVNSVFKKNWAFNKAASLVQQKSSRKTVQLARDKWTRHNIKIDAKGHSLLSSFSYKTADVMRPITGASELIAEVLVDSVVVARQGIELELFHVPKIIPFNNNQFYYLVHPAIDVPYQIKIYNVPDRELFAVFDFSGD